MKRIVHFLSRHVAHARWPALTPGRAWTPRFTVPLLLVALVMLGGQVSALSEVRYFCSPARPAASGPWTVDIDVDGTPDLTIAFAGANITVLPTLGNSVLATNRSYYTNIPSLPDPVLVAFPDEVASLAAGDVVNFANPSRPFWRETGQGDSQPLALQMNLPEAPGSSVAAYFAVKLRLADGWRLAWVRARLTSGPAPECAIDWACEFLRAPLLVNKIVVGSRPPSVTIHSVKKTVDFGLFSDAEIDLDGNGTGDFLVGGIALTTSGGQTNIILPNGDWPTNQPPPSVAYFSFSIAPSPRNEILRNGAGVVVFQSGAGISDFVPPGAYWSDHSALVASTGLGTNGSWHGPLGEVGSRYLGVRVWKNDQFYYGWIKAQVDMATGFLGPVVTEWSVETRPNVPIVAGAPGAPLAPAGSVPAFAGGQTVIHVSGLNGVSTVLSASIDLAHWTPLVTNTVPFTVVLPASNSPGARFFRTEVQ